MAFRLLDLPPELRLEIYEYSLLGLGEYDVISVFRVSDKPDRDPHTQPALLQVNRQIRTEASFVYYRDNVFEAWNGENIEAWLATNPKRARQVQSVVFGCGFKEHPNLQLARCECESRSGRSTRMAWLAYWRCDEDIPDYGDELIEYDEVPECLCSDRRIEEAAAVQSEVEAEEGWRVALGMPPSDEDYLHALRRYVRVFRDREEDPALCAGTHNRASGGNEDAGSGLGASERPASLVIIIA